jgi:molybdopterin/thiamine biosynthesis adenylyltransferase
MYSHADHFVLTAFLLFSFYASVTPLVDGGTEGFKGNVRVILPGMNACIECTLDLFPPQVLNSPPPLDSFSFGLISKVVTFFLYFMAFVYESI